MPDNKEPIVELVTRDELKDILRENLADSKLSNSINEDMKLIDMLNTRAVSATNTADAAMYMTIAAELAESIALRAKLEANSRMVKALSSVTEFKNGEKDVTAISFDDKNNPGEKVYYALMDENEEPVNDRFDYNEIADEILEESAGDIKKLKQEMIAVYDKGAKDSLNAMLAHNDHESNKREFAEFTSSYNTTLNNNSLNLIEKDSSSMRSIADDHCNNIRDIANALLNGERFPQNKSEYENITTTMMYLTEKARLNAEVSIGISKLPDGVTGLANKQMAVLKGKIEADAIYSGDNILEKETSA